VSLFALSDIAAFKLDRLQAVIQTYFPSGAMPSDEFLLQQVQAAEQDVIVALKVFLEPTTIFPYTPSDAEVEALDGADWAEEPGYDYDAEFFQGERWGYIVTRQRPIITVTAVNFVYPSPQNSVYQIPNDWLRLDKKYGQIRMVPASSTFVAPLGAFLLQALAGGGTIPSMLQVHYVAGLTDVLTKWPNIVDLIYKTAILKLIRGFFIPQSQSISADGLSQSMSFDADKYQAGLNETMFGPKGSNAGLFTAIHGLANTVMGITV
jgi:hypothetical protein